MNEYLIGSGAILNAGPSASIAGASLHARMDPAIAGSVQAALVDFEASESAELSQVVILATGWNARQFDRAVVAPLLDRSACTLADVLGTLAGAVGTRQVHLFARWMPDDVLLAGLRRQHIELIAHPLESITQAALVSGQKRKLWKSPLRAA